MHSQLPLLVALFAFAPLAAQAPSDPDGTPFFLRKPPPPADALKAYTDQPYRPVRRGEVQSAAFLTEGVQMAFGRALGPTQPSQIRSQGGASVTAIGTDFAVRPPSGGSYRVGDTLMVATVSAGPRNWGERVIPTAMLVVTGELDGAVVTRVTAIYGVLTADQVVYLAAPFGSPGIVQPVPVSDGPTGAVIAPVTPRELMMSSGHLFTDLGQRDGVRIGDFVELRRGGGSASQAVGAAGESMATGQVVYVGPNSSTVKLTNVIEPDIRAGTQVVRVATLP